MNHSLNNIQNFVYSRQMSFQGDLSVILREYIQDKQEINHHPSFNNISQHPELLKEELK
jgi:hypothetical protein